MNKKTDTTQLNSVRRKGIWVPEKGRDVMVKRVTNNGVHDVKEQYGEALSSTRERDLGVLVLLGF